MSSPSVKAAVPARPRSPSADATERAMPTASEDPRVSTHNSLGAWARRPCFTGADHITPDDVMTRSDDTSHRSGSASSAARSGLAKASPTMAMLLTRSRSIVSRISTTENRRSTSVTTHPPLDRAMNELKAPVPCMSGAAVRCTGPGLVSDSATPASPPSSGWCTAAEALRSAKRSSWSPHHPFGQPGGPPGVDEVEVIRATTPRRACGLAGPSGSGHDAVPAGGPRGALTGAVVDMDPSLHDGEVRADLLDAVGELPVEDHRGRVGVLPEVGQLARAVAVVRVDRGQTELERGEDRFEVLRRGVEVLRHGLAGPRPLGQQPGGERIGVAVELGPGEPALSLHQGGSVGKDRGHGLPDVGEVPCGHGRRSSHIRTDPPSRTVSGFAEASPEIHAPCERQRRSVASARATRGGSARRRGPVRPATDRRGRRRGRTSR